MVVPVGRDMNLLMRNHQFEVSSLEQSLTTLLSDEQKGQIMDLRLMMLRFILSSDGNVSKAEANLKSYIEWRFKSDDGRAVYTCIQSSRYPHGWETMQKFSAVGFHGQSLDGDFLFVIRAGLSNGKALMSALTHDQLVHIMIFNRARMMEICDEETLKTGRLTKFITINDLAHTSLSKISGPFNSVLTATAKLSEVYFPQLLDSAVLINMPRSLLVLFSTFKRLLPQKVQSKIRVCGAVKGGSISKCPWAKLHLATSSVPSFLGGECRCPHKGGCIEGIDNDQKVANLDSEDGLTAWTISRGKKYEIFVPVKESGSTLVWQVQVDPGTISSGSVVLEACLRDLTSEVLSTLIDKKEVKPGQGVISGEVVVPLAPGTIVFALTNTSSIWSRSVKYRVDLITSRGDLIEGRTDEETERQAEGLPPQP